MWSCTGRFLLKEGGCSPSCSFFCLSVDACTRPQGACPRPCTESEQQRRAVDPFQCPGGKIDARSLASFYHPHDGK